jgi:hypothetical protein
MDRYTHSNACPPLGGYFANVLSKPRAAWGVGPAPLIRMSLVENVGCFLQLALDCECRRTEG